MTATLDYLSFLIGEWVALSQPGEPTGGFTFSLQLQGKAILRTNYADYPATAGRPASRHEDLLVIYLEDGALRGDYYDSEGHVIRYTGESGPGVVTFTSPPTANEPGFRLSYRLAPGGLLEGAFEIITPGGPVPYLAWQAKKADS